METNEKSNFYFAISTCLNNYFDVFNNNFDVDVVR